jgi:hypothetical protein
MMRRRGEVPFVAVRVGRSNDPREVLSLARELKTIPATALGFVVLWEEFLLEVGDAMTGRIKGYSAEHIAAKLGWVGQPKKLIEALKNAGLLKTQRNVYFHPYWLQSITGQYARERAELREQWREAKRRQKEKNGDQEFLQDSFGKGEDVHPVSDRKTDINQLRDSAEPSPQPPPGGGGEKGSARWEWVQENHKRPRNSQACIKYLGAMTDENWALCQWVVEQARPGGALSLSRKKRALALDSYRFIANEAFLEFLPERRQKLEGQKRATAAAASVEPTKDKEATSIAFLIEQLNDPDLPDDKKTKLRTRWRDQNPDASPPWEQGPGAPGARGAARSAQA